jgi:hypothetical protein
MTGPQLKEVVWEKYGVDVSVQAIMEHVKKARQNAEEITKNTDAHINKKIAERVDKEVVPLMEIMEREILRLSNALEGCDPRLRVKPEYDRDGIETGFVQAREYTMIGKELRENIKSYISLRPQVCVVKIDELSGDKERSFLDMCSDEEVAMIESLKRRWEEQHPGEPLPE